MARNADTLPVEPVINLVDDGRSAPEIATLCGVAVGPRGRPSRFLAVSPIDELRNAYADDDV